MILRKTQSACRSESSLQAVNLGPSSHSPKLHIRALFSRLFWTAVARHRFVLSQHTDSNSIPPPRLVKERHFIHSQSCTIVHYFPGAHQSPDHQGASTLDSRKNTSALSFPNLHIMHYLSVCPVPNRPLVRRFTRPYYFIKLALFLEFNDLRFTRASPWLGNTQFPRQCTSCSRVL